jgi:DNA-binding NarL/FixJ family response regulator
MPIRVLLAEDSKVVRAAIAHLLKGDSRIELVGEATGFAETLELVAALKPDVLLIDLHMNDERKYPPHVVKSQVLQSTGRVLAMSLSDDEIAKALAASVGAQVLLDKSKLSSELIPTIVQAA